MVGWIFLTGPRMGDPEMILVGNLERPPAGGTRTIFGWKVLR